MGMGRVRVQKQVVEGKDPKWRPAVNMRGRNGTVSERGRGAMGW